MTNTFGRRYLSRADKWNSVEEKRMICESISVYGKRTSKEVAEDTGLDFTLVKNTMTRMRSAGVLRRVRVRRDHSIEYEVVIHP